MPDRIGAKILIGGELPKALVEGLCEAISFDQPSLEWGGSDFEPQNATKDGLLCLYDDEAAWGEFDAIERFCIEHEIEFDRDSEGKYEYDPESQRFRKGMKEPYAELSDHSGETCVSKADVRKVRELLNKDKTKAIIMLDNIIGPDIPGLTPFRIV